MGIKSGEKRRLQEREKQLVLVHLCAILVLSLPEVIIVSVIKVDMFAILATVGRSWIFKWRLLQVKVTGHRHANIIWVLVRRPLPKYM